MAIAQTGVNMNFTANTAAAQAQIAALEKRLATLQGLMGRRVKMAAFDTSGFDVRINSQVRAMDELTKRIQKGTITSKEFNDTLKNRNGLLEYQQKLNKATALSAMTPMMRSGQAVGSIDLRNVSNTTNRLREGAVALSTYASAAEAYGKQIMNVGKNMAFMGRQALLSVTGPIALIGAGSAAAFYQYDKQLTNIVKLSGDSDKAFKASSDSIRAASMDLARDMSTNLGVAIKDSLKLQETLSALGKSGRELKDATESAGRLMVLGDLDPDTAIKFTNTIQTVFHATAEEADNYINLINEMENSTVLTMQDVSDAMPKIGPIIKSMNMEVKDGLVLLEALKRGGVDAVEGANAVKSITGSIFRSTKKLQDAYAKAMPGDTWGDMVARNGNNLINILGDLGNMMKDWDVDKKLRLFYQIGGKEQAAKLIQLTDSLAKGNDQVTKTLAKSEGELRAIANQEIDAIMASTSKQFQVQIQRALDFAQKIGSKVLPPIVDIMTKFFDVLSKGAEIVGNVMEALGPIGDMIGFIGKASIIALAGFGPLLLAISAMAMIRGAAITGMAKATRGLSAGMNMLGGGGFNSPKFITMQQKAQELAAGAQNKAQLTAKQTTQQLTAAIDKLTASYERLAVASGTATARTGGVAASQRATASQLNANPALMPAGYRASAAEAAQARQASYFSAFNGGVNPTAAAARNNAPLTPMVMPGANAARQSAISARTAAQERFERNQARVAARDAARSSSLANMNAMIVGAPGSGINNAPRAAGATSGVITTGQPTAERAAAAQERAAASAQKWGQAIGGVTVAAGLLTTMFGGTNQMVNNIAAGLSVVGLTMMMIPSLAGAIGKAFAFMWTKALAGGMFMFNTLALAAPILAAKLKAVGMSLMAAGPMLLGIVAAVAAVGVAIYAIHRAITADQREYLDMQEKITNSAKAHADVLGFTLLETGQILDEQGKVEETAASLAKKYSDNETASGGFLKSMKENTGNLGELRLILSQEAIKIKARGGSDADVQKMVEASLLAAGADQATIDTLKVDFQDVSFAINNASGDEFQKRLQELYSGADRDKATQGDKVRSWWDNPLSWHTEDMVKPGEDLSKGAEAEAKQYAEVFGTAMASATEEQKDKLSRAWTSTIGDAILEADDKGIAQKKAAATIEELGKTNPAKFAQFNNEDNNLKFIKEAGDLATVLGIVGTKFKDTREATDFYNESMKRLVELLGRDLSNAEKGALINSIRAAQGLTQLEGSADDAGSALGKVVREGNIGPDLKALAADSDNAAGAIGGLAKAGETLEDLTVNWDLVINVDGAGGLNNLEMTLGQYKEAMQKTQSDMFDAASRMAQESFDATMKDLKASQDASLAALDQVAKEQEERSKEAEKAMDKAQDLEKKAFDKGWKDREKAEKQMFEDRIKAIEDVGEREDELERQRKRNAERESARLRYLAQLATNNVDMQTALASGDMDTASKLSINAGVQANDYATESQDREAGYKKDDDDRSRKTAIDLIKEEEDARMEMLQNQKEQEQAAMEERFEIQKEEFARRRQLEQEDLAAKKAALQAEFEATNANEQAMFAANQRRMQMELDTLRATLPRTTEEMNKQKAQIEEIYARYGIQLQFQGTEWSNIIGTSLEQRMLAAQNTMSDQRAWADFGQRVSDGVARGAFNMSSPEFNNFLRTGEMPGAGVKQGAQAGAAFGIRHGGGPVNSKGYDKYNSRGGIPMNAPMRSNEKLLLAKNDEYVVRGAAHKKYGTDFFNKLNSGAVSPNVIRHEGGPIDQQQASAVRHDGGPTGIGGLGAAITAAGLGAIISRVSLATGKAMQSAIASGSFGGEYIGAGAAAEAVAFAKRESGKPYQYGGGGDPSWDCSGFMGAIWKILVGRNPLGRVFSTEDFRNGGGTKFGFAPGLDPQFPNGFSLGFHHGPGGGANSHVAGTLLGANVESGGTNGVQYGPKAWGANNPYFHDFWHLPGVSGTKPKVEGGLDTSQYDDWTTVGIQKYGEKMRDLFGPKDQGGGGALGDVQTGNREFYIKEIVDEVKRRGMSKKAAVIALMTAMQESSLLMYANSNVPASLALPHDAVGSDHDSVGLFQQRGNGAWGSLQQRMNARASAGAFLAALARFNYESMNENDAAQKVQVSGTPLAYGKWKGDATAQANRYFDKGGVGRGTGFLPKNVIKPERVLSPQQTKAFEDLIPLLTGSNKGITGFKPIINAIKNDSNGMISSAKNAAADALNKAGYQVPNLEMTFINKGNINSQLDLDAWADQIKRETIEEFKRQQRLAERKIK